MEKLIYYKTFDGMCFDNENMAKHYENNILIPLLKKEQECLGNRLNINQNIGEPPCIEFRQHTQENLIAIIKELLYILKEYQLKIDGNENLDNFYLKCKNNFTIICDETLNIEERHKAFNDLMVYLDIISYITYKDDKFRPDKSISYLISDRLRRTSFRTGKEFPNCVYINRENEFDMFVEHTKEYIKNGGKYR